ncbi:MAG: (d)CMP kinase, partial [Planctomycetales bacterium]|nr:(d)CMP kinase [Planctomycetales bacterium]
MIVTIDGPAGAGKSSAARKLAQRLGFRFLDTGAMYRSVALLAWRRQIDFRDQQQLAQIAREMDLELSEDAVIVNGEDVTQAIRSFEITTLTRYAADCRSVRDELTRRQREFAAEVDVVTEGRDQATVVFPDAECKIFL